MERPEKEISVAYVGERVMEALQHMDDVAYVRFASVYRSFRDIEEFMREIKELYELREAREHSRSQNGSPDQSGEVLDPT
jgi:transcriptional repressor NrdR